MLGRPQSKKVDISDVDLGDYFQLTSDRYGLDCGVEPE
jgi:hypothetical protein